MRFIRDDPPTVAGGSATVWYHCMTDPPVGAHEVASGYIVVNRFGVEFWNDFPTLTSLEECVLFEETIARTRLHMQHLATHDQALPEEEIDRRLTITLPSY